VATTRTRRRWPWLVVAAVLLALGAWLTLGAEPPPRPPPPQVKMPRRMSLEEKARGEERQTWVPLPVLDGGVAPPPSRPRDPVMALMPPSVKRGAVVAEVNAILNSELGGLMMDCLFEGDPGALAALRDGGFDPVTKVDRMAFIDDALVITGDFRGANVDRLLPTTPTRIGYGQRGQLLEFPRRDGGMNVVGLWDSQLLVTGADEAATRALLDRLETSGPVPRGVLDESDAWGEVYGAVSAEQLAELLGRENEALAAIVRDNAEGMQMHLDVSHDVGLVGDVRVRDPAKGDELRKALGSALSLARLEAQAAGRQDEAQLLDLALVRGLEGSSFRLEAGLPHDFLKASLERCVERQRARRLERDAERAVERDGGGP